MFLRILAIVTLYWTLTPLGFAQRASFDDAIDFASPSVVNIYAQKVVQTRTAHPFFNDPFFQEFFALQGPVRNRVERSLGSGVIVTDMGHVVTNLHVIEGAEDIRVILHDGTEHPAAYVGGDQNLDLALLKLEATPAVAAMLPVATFLDSDDLKVGDVALAIGNPFGVGQSVSMGVISAVGRGNPALSQFSTYIQTDAAINPGNSGGALVDSTGRVMGINTAIFSRSGASHGIGFAIPANLVQAVLEDLLTTGSVERAWLGASGQNLTPALARQLRLARPQGVLVNELVPNGPAAMAGVQIGDVITALDNRPVANTSGLNAQILATPNASRRALPLTVWRDGRDVVLQVELRSLPQRQAEARQTLSGRHPLAGYMVEELSPALNQTLNLPLDEVGVAVIEVPTRRSFGLALRAGDVIRQVNNTEIKTLGDLEGALVRRPQQWRLTYTRGNRTYRVIVQN